MLTIIQVGNNEASNLYINNKVRAIKKAGMKVMVVNMSEECTTNDVLEVIFEKSNLVECKAIMVQLPLPNHLNKKLILEAIPPHMDIDGLNPHSDYQPLTPCAIMRWLKNRGVDLVGKNVTILGRSELVGKPLANMMIDAGATVTVCNSKTDTADKGHFVRNSDIVVSTTGVIDPVHPTSFISIREQIVIDVGINRDSFGRLCGDIPEFSREIIKRCDGYCTPVPGGVGKWTVEELVLRLKEMEGEN